MWVKLFNFLNKNESNCFFIAYMYQTVSFFFLAYSWSNCFFSCLYIFTLPRLHSLVSNLASFLFFFFPYSPWRTRYHVVVTLNHFLKLYSHLTCRIFCKRRFCAFTFEELLPLSTIVSI